MKKLIILVVLFNITNLYSQQCDYITNETDEFTGKTRKRTVYYETNKDFLYDQSVPVWIFFRRYGTYETFTITTIDLGCTSSYSNNRSYVKIKLVNNDILTFYHVGDIDCSSFKLTAKLSYNDKLRLKKSPIKTIRLSGTDSYWDVKTFSFPDVFIKKLDCIK